jgi:hypothetical protein
MQLREVGVPVMVNPRGEAHSLYEALDDILENLPAAPAPPHRAGEVLVLIGDWTPTLRAAQTVAQMLRIREDTIRVAGLAGHPTVRDESKLAYCTISGPSAARLMQSELNAAATTTIIVIATDASTPDPDDPWATELLEAMQPDAVWAVVDARTKTEDIRAQLDRYGPVDAIVVHSAQASASPASVWDLDLPVALIDGRPASTFVWAGLLFRLLRPSARRGANV